MWWILWVWADWSLTYQTWYIQIEVVVNRSKWWTHQSCQYDEYNRSIYLRYLHCFLDLSQISFDFSFEWLLLSWINLISWQTQIALKFNFFVNLETCKGNNKAKQRTNQESISRMEISLEDCRADWTCNASHCKDAPLETLQILRPFLRVKSWLYHHQSIYNHVNKRSRYWIEYKSACNGHCSFKQAQSQYKHW